MGMDEGGRLFVQLGKRKESESEFQPACVLPGAKAHDQERIADTMQRLLSDKLPQLENCLEILSGEREIMWESSSHPHQILAQSVFCEAYACFRCPHHPREKSGGQ